MLMNHSMHKAQLKNISKTLNKIRQTFIEFKNKKNRNRKIKLLAKLETFFINKTHIPISTR